MVTEVLGVYVVGTFTVYEQLASSSQQMQTSIYKDLGSAAAFRAATAAAAGSAVML
jgi:hypothetical protein